jgi:hypothetical protein
MLLKILILILFFFINIGLAKYDSIRIKKQKRIYHGINAAVYLVMMVVVFYFLRSYSFFIALLAERRIVFDTALNLFRGLRFDYISSSTTSIIDRVSYNFQAKHGYFVYYLIFLITIVVCLFLNF